MRGQHRKENADCYDADKKDWGVRRKVVNCAATAALKARNFKFFLSTVATAEPEFEAGRQKLVQKHCSSQVSSS